MLNQRSDKLELIRIAEAVALEKAIDKDLILSSMESGIEKAAKSRFGFENNIKVTIDRSTGNIDIYRVLIITENPTNHNTEISLVEAKKISKENENFKSWKKSDTSSPVWPPTMRPVGYTSSNASATSNVFVLKEVTSEFSKGDIVTFGDSKKEYEIREAKVLRKIAMPDNTWVVLYHGSKFKISPGSGNIQGIVIKGAVGFVISPGIKVSVVRRSTLDSYPERCNLGR